MAGEVDSEGYCAMTRQSIYPNIMEAIFLSKFKAGMQHKEEEIDSAGCRLSRTSPLVPTSSRR